MTAALIQVSPPLIIAAYQGPPPYLVRAGKWGYTDGFVGYQTPDGAYTIVAVPPFVPPGGQMIVGPPTYAIDGQGNVTQTFSTIPIPANTFIAYTDFLTRLTDAEYIAIKKAIVTQINAGNATVAKWYDIISNTGIDTTLPQTANIKALAVSAGLLTQPRADLIFTP